MEPEVWCMPGKMKILVIITNRINPTQLQSSTMIVLIGNTKKKKRAFIIQPSQQKVDAKTGQVRVL